MAKRIPKPPTESPDPPEIPPDSVPDLTGVRIHQTAEERKYGWIKNSKWAQDRLAARLKRGMSHQAAIDSLTSYHRPKPDPTAPEAKPYSIQITAEEAAFLRIVAGRPNLRAGFELLMTMARVQMNIEAALGVKMINRMRQSSNGHAEHESTQGESA